MERPVKERLVGAAVLIAAAIILIPEMLSGPKRKADAPPPQGDVPLKTYTIDLHRSPGTPPAAELEERAPPPEIVTGAAPPNDAVAATEQTSSENEAEGTQALPESDEPKPPSPSQRVASEQVRTAPPSALSSAPPAGQSQREPATTRERPSVAAEPIASTPSVPTSRGWAVQLGSFASKATADRLAKDLSGSGHDAFVMPVKSGTTTLYRVRIGPFADRAAANDTQRAVKGRVANAAVVAHP